MKVWFNNYINGCLAAVAASSLFVTPISNLSAQGAYYGDNSCAQDCCPQDPCNPCNPCAPSWSSRDSWLLVGSLLLGAAAGAGAGAAASSSGHRGHRGDPGVTGATGATGIAGTVGATGPIGPTGVTGATGPVGVLSATSDVPFGVENTLHSLDFNFATDITVSVGAGTISVTSFIARPDGVVVETTTATLTGPGVLAIPSVGTGSVNLPYGDYVGGFIIANPAGNTLALAASPLVDVVSSRDGTSSMALVGSAAILPTITATSSEATVTFVYGDTPVP